jgi:hypothetical protein
MGFFQCHYENETLPVEEDVIAMRAGLGFLVR